MKKQGLPMFDITLRPVRGVGGEGTIQQVVRSSLSVRSHFDQVAYFYVIPDNLGYDLILGLPWLKHHDARLEPARGRLFLRSSGVRIRSENVKPHPQLDIVAISAASMQANIRRIKKTPTNSPHRLEVFVVTIADIKKALALKKPVDHRTKLPLQYTEFLCLFDPKEAAKLPPHRGNRIDHTIKLVRQNGEEPQVP